MERCSKPFEPDLGETSGGKLKEYGIVFNPLISPKMSGFLFLGKREDF